MGVLDESIGLITEVIGIFKPKEPTPEEQKEKGRVWYRMLKDFVTNEPSPETLALTWRDQLPFAQKATKQRFVDTHIKGQSTDSIIDTLVGKINDELIKGGFSSLSKTAILSGMGASGLTVESPAALSTVDAGVTDPLIGDSLDIGDQKESQMYFLVIGLIALMAGVFAYLFFNRKKKR